jgi:hypothetical protein
MACIGMTVGFVLFWIGAHPGFWLAAIVAALMLASALYVVTRPAPIESSSEARRGKRLCT